MYNRYQGNSGRVERVAEPGETAAPPPQRPAPPGPGEKRPPGTLAGLGGELSRLLRKFTRFELETEDLMLAVLLYLLYRESGDEEFLLMLAGVLLL